MKEEEKRMEIQSHILAIVQVFEDYIDLDSDGFTIQSTSLSFNGSNARYIYYAHA